MRAGFIVAALHLAIVGSLGGKLLLDRATRPRVWARTAPYDPNLPIRGRYVRLQIDAALEPGQESGTWMSDGHLALVDRNGRLTAVKSDEASMHWGTVLARDGEHVVRLNEPIAYFIPEHVPDPSRRQPGEELWVEVTIPTSGAPRPIRLGVKKDGQLTPLD
jgi:hypothetical protein